MSWEPITAVCILEDKYKVPTNFDVIGLTTDNSDADIWKDKSFRKKITRYIAFSRRRLPETADQVLADITVMKDDQATPPGYTSIQFTSDTNEMVLKKKVVVVRFIGRNDTNEAVMDIYLTSGKSKSKPVESSSRSWEIKDISLFLRYGPIIKMQFSNPMNANLPYHFPQQSNGTQLLAQQQGGMVQTPTPPVQGGHRQLHRQTTLRSPEHNKVHVSAIEGVPFVLHSCLTSLMSPDRVEVAAIPSMSQDEIVQKYSYDFTTEHTVKRQAGLQS